MDKVEEMAGLMKEQQRRLDDLHGRVIRLETVLELALHRSSGASGRFLEADGDPPTPEATRPYTTCGVSNPKISKRAGGTSA